MIKNKIKIGLLVVVLTFFVGFGFANYANAANLTWGVATTIDLSSPNVDDLTIADASTATGIVVEAGDIIVTIANGETFTISSASREIALSSTNTSSTGVVKTCTSGVSNVVITGSGANVDYTISPSATQCGTGGSGTGGGTTYTPPDTTAPTSTSISISAGATSTASTAVTLTLAATDATQMIISNDAGFAGAAWETFLTSKSWTLTSGDGVKTVYAKFRDAALNMSTAVSDTITVSGSGTVAVVLPPPTQGCSGGNLYNTSTGALCVNNAGLQIPGCGNRNTGFSTADGQSCIGNRATPATATYNFGTTTLKNGSKGAAVMELQRFLNAKLSLGLAVDGKLGPKTIAVIKTWQGAHGLVADGLIGAKTKAKMNAEE